MNYYIWPSEIRTWIPYTWIQRNNPCLTRYCSVPTKDVQRLPWSTSLAYPRSIILCIICNTISIKWLRTLEGRANNVLIYKALERVVGKSLGSGIPQTYFKPELHCLCDLDQVTSLFPKWWYYQQSLLHRIIIRVNEIMKQKNLTQYLIHDKKCLKIKYKLLIFILVYSE